MGTLATEKKAQFIGSGAWNDNGTPTKLCTHSRASGSNASGSGGFKCVLRTTYSANQIVTTEQIYSKTTTGSCSGQYHPPCGCYNNCGTIVNGGDKNCKENVKTNYPYYYYGTNPNDPYDIVKDYNPKCLTNGCPSANITNNPEYYHGCQCYTVIGMNLANGTNCGGYTNYNVNCSSNGPCTSNGGCNNGTCKKSCSTYCNCDNGAKNHDCDGVGAAALAGNFKCHCNWDSTGEGSYSCSCNTVCGRNCPSDASNTCKCDAHTTSCSVY